MDNRVTQTCRCILLCLYIQEKGLNSSFCFIFYAESMVKGFFFLEDDILKNKVLEKNLGWTYLGSLPLNNNDNLSAFVWCLLPEDMKCWICGIIYVESIIGFFLYFLEKCTQEQDSWESSRKHICVIHTSSYQSHLAMWPWKLQPLEQWPLSMLNISFLHLSEVFE